MGHRIRPKWYGVGRFPLIRYTEETDFGHWPIAK